jgi:translocation and assembly module TamB
MKWGAEVAPSPDESKPVEVKLVAKNFRAIAIAPFVQGAFDEIDGVVNANAALHVKPGFKDGTMEGAIVVDKGVFETPAVGEEFHDLRARISMKPWGVWNVEELSARGTSGRFTATAQAHVNGFHVQSAEAHLKIARKDKLPLSMQGTALGTAWGQIDAKGAMSPDGKTLDIDVSVPSFHVDLEDATGHAVQSTDPDTTVMVGVLDKHGKMERLAFDGTKPLAPPKPSADASTAPPMAIHVVTHLGPDLEILRGTMLKAYVTAGPVIDVGSETKISGGIQVPRGYIELQGKRFQIGESTVTFTGQAPDNPVVQATAVYDSPDGTKVIAKFVGPVKTGKLTLESDPQLTQNEILSLLMFGSADGTFGEAAPPGQQGNDTTQAASLAGGVVTQGLNKAISGVSGVDVETSVDTQETGNPRPEVEVALSRKVSATVMYSLGVPPPGESPDDTLLLLDWRFHKNYSTEATLGDKGTTILDLAWKYRY